MFPGGITLVSTQGLSHSKYRYCMNLFPKDRETLTVPGGLMIAERVALKC